MSEVPLYGTLRSTLLPGISFMFWNPLCVCTGLAHWIASQSGKLPPLQGYLAHKNTPNPPAKPQGPRHRATVGS